MYLFAWNNFIGSSIFLSSVLTQDIAPATGGEFRKRGGLDFEK